MVEESGEAETLLGFTQGHTSKILVGKCTRDTVERKVEEGSKTFDPVVCNLAPHDTLCSTQLWHFAFEETFQGFSLNLIPVDDVLRKRFANVDNIVVLAEEGGVREKSGVAGTCRRRQDEGEQAGAVGSARAWEALYSLGTSLEGDVVDQGLVLLVWVIGVVKEVEQVLTGKFCWNPLRINVRLNAAGESWPVSWGRIPEGSHQISKKHE